MVRRGAVVGVGRLHCCVQSSGSVRRRATWFARITTLHIDPGQCFPRQGTCFPAKGCVVSHPVECTAALATAYDGGQVCHEVGHVPRVVRDA